MSDLSIPVSAGSLAFDPNIANGTCYFAANKPHTGTFLPCGNAAGGEALSCCFAGDQCESSNACHNPETDLTYIAGCTDSTYQAWSCPFKSGIFALEEWVAVTWSCNGLSRNNSEGHDDPGIVAAAAAGHNSVATGQTGMLGSGSPSEDDDSTTADSGGFLHQHGWNISSSAHAPEEHGVKRMRTDPDFDLGETTGWMGCPIQDASATPDTFHGSCNSCLASLNGASLEILFQDTKGLTLVATLPQAMGGIVLWEAGFQPSGEGVSPPATTSMSTCASTMTGTGGPGGAAHPTGGTNTTPSATDPNGVAATTQPGNSRMNVIVGATSGCVIALLLGALAWLLWKRHQRHKQEKAVIREQHMALARGPSPPRIPTGQRNGRGGDGSGPCTPTTPKFLAPIRSLRGAVRGSTSFRRGSSQLEGGKRRSQHQRLSTATTETTGNSMYMVPSNPASMSATAGIATPLAPSTSTQPLISQSRPQPERSVSAESLLETSPTAIAPLLRTNSRSNTFGRSSPPMMDAVEVLHGGGSPRSTKTIIKTRSVDNAEGLGSRGLESLSRQSSMTQDTIQEARRLQVHVVDPSMARILLLGEKDAERSDAK